MLAHLDELSFACVHLNIYYALSSMRTGVVQCSWLYPHSHGVVPSWLVKIMTQFAASPDDMKRSKVNRWFVVHANCCGIVSIYKNKISPTYMSNFLLRYAASGLIWKSRQFEWVNTVSTFLPNFLFSQTSLSYLSIMMGYPLTLQFMHLPSHHGLHYKFVWCSGN